MRKDRTQRKWGESEYRVVKLIKDTFARELAIRRQKPFAFLKENRMTEDYNNLAKMLEGNEGCNILTLSRIADAFGYDIELVKREEEL